jgi:hypothetical protein
MRIPFWLPAAWIGLTLALLPRWPWMTLVGYHLLCLVGYARQGGARWGRVPAAAWGAAAVGALLAGLLLTQPTPGRALLPTAGAQAFLAYWPGGFPSYVGYTLTVNSLCEELFWRRGMPTQHPHWPDHRHALAFGLHHMVGNGLVFGWATALPALLYTAAGGWLALRVSRWTGGLGTVILGHSLLNALSFAWLSRQLG